VTTLSDALTAYRICTKAYSHHRFTKPQDRPLSLQSIVSYVGAIKSFFSFVGREQIIPSNPVENVKLKSPRKVIALKGLPVNAYQQASLLLHH